MSIRESALSLISSISQSDYLRAVTSGGNSRRVTMANAAKAVVEGYSGSSLGGSQRTVKAAIDAMANDVDIITKIAIKNTASGPVASFPDGSDGLPFQSLIADINPVQSGSGTPSPQNIRPISGTDNVDTYVRGINIWNENGVRLGWYDSSTGAWISNTSAGQLGNIYPIQVVGGESYYIKTPSRLRILQYKADGTFISASNHNDEVLTMNGECAYINFNTFSGESSYPTYPTYNYDISINYPSTDHDYHAYNGTTYTTPLGRTVYGGTLDLVSGVLTVTHKYISETAQFTGASSYNTDTSHKNAIFWYACSDSAVATDTNAKYGIVCSGLEEITFNQALSTSAEYYGVYLNNSANTTMLRVAIPKSLGITTKDDANSWLTSIGGLQIAYPLATPQTYQLTPQQIQTLLGTNNVWADSGDVEVVYIADTKLYVDNH